MVIRYSGSGRVSCHILQPLMLPRGLMPGTPDSLGKGLLSSPLSSPLVSTSIIVSLMEDLVVSVCLGQLLFKLTAPMGWSLSLSLSMSKVVGSQVFRSSSMVSRQEPFPMIPLDPTPSPLMSPVTDRATQSP